MNFRTLFGLCPEHVPDAGNAYHGLVKVLVRRDTVCGVKHGLCAAGSWTMSNMDLMERNKWTTCLTCALVLGLRDDPAVSVHNHIFVIGSGSRRRRESPGGPEPDVAGAEGVHRDMVGGSESQVAYWTELQLRLFVFSAFRART